MSLKKLTIAAVVGAAAMLVAGSDAHAFWWRHHSSGGSYGSWGSSGGSWGSHGGLFHRHHHWGSWGSSGGSWGSYGSSGGSWGSSGGYSYGSSGGSWGSSGGYSYGSSGGSWGSSGGYSTGYYGDGGYNGNPVGPVNNGAPAGNNPAGGPPPAPTNPGPAGNGNVELPAPDSTSYGTTATLFVSVPADAKVYVNDRLTTSTGTDRRYMSGGLQAGRVYSYTIRVEIERNGEIVSDTKVVKLEAGGSTQLAFNMSRENIRTALILHVPADAKVFLAGKETKATGSVREFSTTRLSKGAEWASYPVRVEIQRDGEILVKEETLSLAAGEVREVNIDFDAPQVADLRQ